MATCSKNSAARLSKPRERALRNLGNPDDIAANPCSFHFVTITWGDNHTGIFLDVALPSQLSPGNLPALENGKRSIYKIYTTEADAQIISAHPAYERLRSLMPTEIITIDLGVSGKPHEILTHYHKESIRAAAAVGATVVFLAPDNVVADGCYRNMERLHRQGKKAVIIAGLRLNKESFIPEFRRQWLPDGRIVATVPPRDLVRLAMSHLHPTSESLEWPPRSCWPSHLYWRIGASGLLAHCYHMHPLYVVTRSSEVNFNSTIDGDYVLKAYPRQDDLHVVVDSDELLVCEISPRDYSVGVIESSIDEQAVGKWAACWANALHLRLFRRTIRFRGGESDDEWSDVSRSSAKVVEKIKTLQSWYRVRFFFIRLLLPIARKLRVRGAYNRSMRVIRRLIPRWH